MKTIYDSLIENDDLDLLNVEEQKIAQEISKHSKRKFTFKCKQCGSSRKTSFYSHEKSMGCSNCVKETSKKKLIAKYGSIEEFLLSNPDIKDQYCYDQPFLEENHKNTQHPATIPINSKISVHWYCEKGHYSRTSPELRLRNGQRCSSCSSALARGEAYLFLELEQELPTCSVFHRFHIDRKESDIVILDTTNNVSYAIEVDGKYYHQKRVEEDTAKNLTFQKNNFKTIRVREQGLPKLEYTDFHIEISKRIKGNQPDYAAFVEIYRIITATKPSSRGWKHGIKADQYFNDAQNVKFEDSVANKYPQLVNELDTSKTGIRLQNVTTGSSLRVPWICKKCGTEWETTIDKRCGDNATNCPGCKGQVATKHNNLQVIYPILAKLILDPNPVNLTPKSGATVLIRCGYPGCTKESKKVLRDCVIQFENHNRYWNYDCQHAGHMIISDENKENRNTKISQAAWQKRNDELARRHSHTSDGLTEYWEEQLLRPSHNGLRCPDCGMESYIGTSLTARRSVVWAGDFQCGFCLASGNTITVKPGVAGTIIQNLEKIKILIDDLLAKNWTIDTSFNAFGISYKSGNLLVSARSSLGHLASYSLRKWRLYDFSVCSCPECRSTKQKRTKDLRETYTNLEIIDEQNTQILCNCGKTTAYHGNTILHPDFFVSIKNKERNLRDSGDICPACALEQQKNICTPKTLGFATFRWQLNAIKAGLPLPPEATLKSQQSCDQLTQIRTSGKGNELDFKCANPNHPICSMTYDNCFNKEKKGYCKHCLKELGINKISDLG